MIGANNITDDAAIADRRLRDERIYNFVRSGQDAQAAVNKLTAPMAMEPGTLERAGIHTLGDVADRMRELTKLPKKPPLNPKRLRGLEKLADIVRPRANSRSKMYGLGDDAEDVRCAIEYIDALVLHHRRNK
jgi:hypothetical protein